MWQHFDFLFEADKKAKVTQSKLFKYVVYYKKRKKQLTFPLQGNNPTLPQKKHT